ncbi:CopG family transcriptional regulator [bacterium]|nr:CopG family transcriptional regulator [bacterium]
MEKRIGSVLIIIRDKCHVTELNAILSSHCDIICGRMGLKAGPQAVSIISLIICGTTDRIGSLTGKIGKIKGLEVKSVLSKYTETEGGEKNEITKH